MKSKILLCITILCLIVLGISCKKSSPTKDPDNTGGTNNGGGTVVVDPNKEVSPTNADGLSKILVFPSATSVASPTLPATSAPAEAPVVVNFDQVISYSAGGKIVVLADVSAINNIKGVYIQVKGSTQYWDVPINAGVKAGSVSMPFTLPKNIGEGTFILILKFYDVNGKISSSTEIKITVTKQVTCGVTRVSGGQGLTSNLFKLPETSGKIKIAYETFTVKDKIDVYQNGTWIGGTGPSTERSKLRRALDCSVATEDKGYVGKKSEFLFNYDPAMGTDIEVVVSGCEDGGTKWEYTFSCPGDFNKINTPDVITAAITGIELDKAKGGGEVTTNNGYDVTERGIIWSTSPAPIVNLTTKTVDGTGNGVFISAIAGLTQNTKYYVRAYATNSVGTGYGNEVSFTTTSLQVPTVVTLPPSPIGLTNVGGNGNVTSANGGIITARGFVWSTTAGPTVALSTKTNNGTGLGSFTANITGLAEGTKYFLRAYATNAAGTGYGTEFSFTTLQNQIFLPSVTTTSVSAITQTTATAGGNVTLSIGAAVTSRGIVWSTSPLPTTALSTKSTSGSGLGTYSVNMTGLTANTKYYVRAYAISSSGTGYGDQLSFTTLAVAPINLNLDGEWSTENGNTARISGSSGVLTALSTGWQAASVKGYLKIGDLKFKNIVKTSTYKYTCIELNVETQLGVPIKSLWSEDGTITMANDGKTFSITSLNKLTNNNVTSTVTWTRK